MEERLTSNLFATNVNSLMPKTPSDSVASCEWVNYPYRLHKPARDLYIPSRVSLTRFVNREAGSACETEVHSKTNASKRTESDLISTYESECASEIIKYLHTYCE